MKVYVTKFALTKGITEAEGEICKDISDKMFKVKTEYPTYYHNKEWHVTLDDAIRHADKMRKKKVASLKKQIKKYEMMLFNLPK